MVFAIKAIIIESIINSTYPKVIISIKEPLLIKEFKELDLKKAIKGKVIIIKIIIVRSTRVIRE